jgi:hypothetical protein
MQRWRVVDYFLARLWFLPVASPTPCCRIARGPPARPERRIRQTALTDACQDMFSYVQKEIARL